MIKRFLFIAFCLVMIPILGYGQSNNVYRVALWRAAPGHLMDLIGELQERSQQVAANSGVSYIIRHSQGDHWDLMTIELIDGMASYSSGENPLSPTYEDDIFDWVSFNEEVFAFGPSHTQSREVFDGNNYFHVEMFNALAGKRGELLKEREMENAYLANLSRPQNLIFRKISGANWDVFTIGGYRDIKHYAESADISLEAEEKAAKAAGFEGVTAISPYLRSLIASHHDTLANKVK